MKNILLMFCISLIIALSGCMFQSARYSPDEIKSFSQPVQDHIKHGEVATGMTQQQVRYSWGAPYTVNVLQPEDGKYREEWVYTRTGIFKTRLIFIDGKLTHIVSNEPGVLR